MFVEDEGLSGDRGLSIGERDFKESADFDERKSNRWSKVELHDGSEVRVAELILEYALDRVDSDMGGRLTVIGDSRGFCRMVCGGGCSQGKIGSSSISYQCQSDNEPQQT